MNVIKWLCFCGLSFLNLFVFVFRLGFDVLYWKPGLLWWFAINCDCLISNAWWCLLIDWCWDDVHIKMLIQVIHKLCEQMHDIMIVIVRWSRMCMSNVNELICEVLSSRVFGMIECYYFESMNDFAQVFYDWINCLFCIIWSRPFVGTLFIGQIHKVSLLKENTLCSILWTLSLEHTLKPLIEKSLPWVK